MDNKKLTTLVLAAGKGTRMKSKRAKVLHEVFFKPMIHHVLGATIGLPIDKNIVISGHQAAAVEAGLADYKVVFVHQEEQLGTGHAVRCAEDILRQVGGTVMILCGDTPLIEPETLVAMYAAHQDSSAPITVMTTMLDKPQNYGRIVCGQDGRVLRIVEEKDANSDERQIKEVNAGIYCVDVDYLCDALHKLDTDNQQGEFYLTDIIEIANNDARLANKYVCPDPLQVLGVNSREELALAHRHLQARRNGQLMAAGVTILQPESVCIEDSVQMGNDIIISAQAHITGNSNIGCGCRIEPNVVIRDSRLGENVTIGSFACLVDCEVGDNEVVPSYYHL